MTLKAIKFLGQNWLTDETILEKIIAAAGDIQKQQILEIGPGTGLLTERLLGAGAHVTAVELDPRAQDFVAKKFQKSKRFQLIRKSILNQSVSELMEGNQYRVIANIPYNITSPIVKKFMSEEEMRPTEMLLMVQREVAERIADTKKRSVLSISVEVFAESEVLFVVPPEAFDPPPKVHSAIIRITTRPKPLVPNNEQQQFFKVVKAGFLSKRKKLKNTLIPALGLPKDTDIATIFGSVDSNRRAENLIISEWQEIAKNL